MNTQKYDGYKLCFLDVETTGLNRTLHNIFQISGVITDPNCSELESFNFLFRPYCTKNIQQEALEKTGFTLQQMEELSMSSEEAYKGLIDVLSRHCNRYDKKDKMHFVAYNASFDCDFLREFFTKHNDNYFGSWFFTPAICVMQASAWLTQRVRGAFPNFKLGTICQCACIGWDESSAHDASYDIQQTVKLFRYLNENLSKL